VHAELGIAGFQQVEVAVLGPDEPAGPVDDRLEQRLRVLAVEQRERRLVQCQELRSLGRGRLRERRCVQTPTSLSEPHDRDIGVLTPVVERGALPFGQALTRAP